MNQLILGDNLEIMRKMESESIDLIYLDPPFFSNRNYEVIWGDKGEIRSFEDRWSGGIDHYIAWLKERVAEMHRLLKPTGSIYLHCDWHADAYIRVLILDKIFGENNFRNEVIWCYSIGGKSKKSFGRKHDNIFFYTKTKRYIFNEDGAKIPRKPNSHMKVGIDSNNREYQEKIDKKTGKVYRYYLDEGKIAEDYWFDIETLNREDRERIGYPTQKPEKLLERIIQASSNEGDIVFDPFVGGGTTIVVADKLNRKWLGIDQSVQAIKVSEMRLNKQQNLFSEPFSVQLHKYDYDTLRYKDAFEFEKWIVEQFEGIANIKQRGDLGMDGKRRDGTPIQVKRSDNIGRNVIDNFKSACVRYDKNLFEKNKKAGNPVGYIIAFSFGKGAVQEVARLKNEENIIIELVTVDTIVPIAKKPKLTVTLKDLGTVPGKGKTQLREIEFTAHGESDSGIEFYSWDFDYQPHPDPLQKEREKEVARFDASIMLDKDGKQNHKFEPGQHTIAIKAVDNEGLEAIEVVRVKVNGEVERE